MKREGGNKRLIMATAVVVVILLIIGVVFLKMANGGKGEPVAQVPNKQTVQQQQQATNQTGNSSEELLQQIALQLEEQKQMLENQQEEIDAIKEGTPSEEENAGEVATGTPVTTPPATNEGQGASKEITQTNEQVKPSGVGSENTATPPKAVSPTMVKTTKESLGVAQSTKTVKVTVSDKRLYVVKGMDSDVPTTNTVYTVITKSEDGSLQLPIYVTYSTYSSLNVGDKLTATYSTHTLNGATVYDVYKVEK